ncbi:MAG: D-amino acid aminotransferase [Thiogranum sp.]
MPTVYLNGKFVPIEDALIPVTDRGFLFGDGVYEVIPAYGGRLFRLSHHLQRLQNSLNGIRLDNPHSDGEWKAILNTLLEHNRGLGGADNDQSVYLQVTRGSAAKRDHSFPENVIPTVFATSNAIADPDPAVIEQGVAAITLDDIRWQHCDIKAVTLLANVLLRQQAVDQNAAEAILIRNGSVIEGSSSNVFVIEAGNILTPAKGPQMLPGITRDLVLELAEQHRLPCRETDISEDSLREADEIWITSSTREIIPVTVLDGTAVGQGSPGPLWKTMIEFYRAYKASVRDGTAEW